MPSSQPLQGFHFQVDLGNGAIAGFQSVGPLTAETAIVGYREGSDKVATLRKYPGLTTYPNVRLSRGLGQNLELWQWFLSKERRLIVITLLDDQMQPAVRFKLLNAWPCKWELSEFDASRNEVAIETLDITHEGLTIESF
jgi:phage tail-like protein